MFENRLRCDKVTESWNVGTFYTVALRVRLLITLVALVGPMTAQTICDETKTLQFVPLGQVRGRQLDFLSSTAATEHLSTVACLINNKSAQSNLGKSRVSAKVSPPWLQWRAPNLTPKVPIPVNRSPKRITCLIPGPVRPMMLKGLRIRSAVFPQCTGQTDAPTDRSSTGS